MLQFWKFIVQIIFISNFCNEIFAFEFSYSFNSSKHLREYNQLSNANCNYKNKFQNCKCYNQDVVEDSFLTTCELVQKYSYQCENHVVETEDGYLLEMHRIPKAGGQPVLLMHQTLDSSSTWVITGPGKGLAYILSKMGYDVWMGNVRGNTYSRKHKKLTPSISNFWEFSLDEIGKYDMPAMIDYVLKKSHKFEKIHYIGHAQGNTLFWILCHFRPEYNEKVLSVQALAPTAFLSLTTSIQLLTMANRLDLFEALTNSLKIYEFLPNRKYIKIISQDFCKKDAFTQPICENLLFMVAGFNEGKMNKTTLPVITSHFPAGSSVRQVIHFLQMVKSGYFRCYDFGLNKNSKIYGQEQPPEYDLSKVKAKVAFYYSKNDWVVNQKDVEILKCKLSNVISIHLIDERYNHFDYLWAVNANEIVYEKLFKVMKKVEMEYKMSQCKY